MPVPTDLANCVLWLDADDASTFTYSSGVEVSQWNDKSGGARHLSQATVGKQPSRTGTLNARSIVTFTRANADCLRRTGTAILSGTTATLFIVAYLDGAPSGSDDRVFGVNTVSNEDYQAGGAVFAYATTSYFPDSYRDGAGSTSHASTVMHTQWLTITSLFNGTNHTMYTGTTAYTSVASTATFSATQTNLGCVKDGTQTANMRVAEVILYSDAKSSGDRTTVWDYLTAKWFTAGGTNATATPAVIARSVAIPAAQPQASKVVAAPLIARSAVIAQAQPQASKVVAAPLIARSVIIPQATTTGGGSATAAPALIARSVVIPAAQPQASKVVAAPLISRSVVIAQATAIGGSTGLASPAVIARVVALPAPTLLAGSGAAPAVIALTVTLPAPITGTVLSDTASPTVITLTVVMPAPHAQGAGVYSLYVGSLPVTAAYLGSVLIDGNNIHLDDAVGMFAAASGLAIEALVAVVNMYYGPDPVDAVYLGDTLITNTHVGAP